MHKILLSILLFYSLSLPGYCQPFPTPPSPIPDPELPPAKVQLKWEIPGQRPPSNNVIFIVDTSGSMDGQKVQSAIKSTMQIAEVPMDDLQIAIVSFGSRVMRWEGTNDIDPQTKKPLSRHRWSLMPSQDNLTAAYQWLQNHCDHGSTHIRLAIAHAFETSMKGKEQVKDLSIIIISDGDFYPLDYSYLKKMIAEYQKQRIDTHLPPAAIGFFGIDVKDRCNEKIKILVGKLTKDELTKDEDPGHWVADTCILGYCRLVYLRDEEDE